MDIGTSEQTTISIYNLLGELVKHQSLKNGSTKMDISDLKSGIYFVTFNNKEFKHTLKFVKE